MRAVFADTGYLIALLNPRDRLHPKAKAVSSALGPHRVVTSEMVLTEYLNDFSRRGAFMRRLAVATVQRLREDRNTTIVPQTSVLFRDAFSLYAARGDKPWSHTECASISIMQRYGLREALTHDRNFEQAGFKALLRDER